MHEFRRGIEEQGRLDLIGVVAVSRLLGRDARQRFARSVQTERLHAELRPEIARHHVDQGRVAAVRVVEDNFVEAAGGDACAEVADDGEKGLRARPRSSSGRWALLRSQTERIDVEAFARRLLARYGVVFRDVIARETLAPPWRELLIALRRLEARGEIRGGRFVSGYAGEQFALPEAIDTLRAVRREGADGPIVEIPSHDPLYFVATLVPGAVLRPLRSVV